MTTPAPGQPSAAHPGPGEPAPVSSEVLAVVTHPDAPLVLTLDGHLPRVILPHGVHDGQGVAAAFTERLGLPLELLRRLEHRALPDRDGVRQRHAVWNLHAPHPGAGAWTAPGDLHAAEQPWAQAALAPAPPARPRWQRPGGLAELTAWLDEELHAQDRPRTGEPQVLRHTQISFLARVPTRTGPLYLKAVPDFFALEVPVTCRLSRRVPGAAAGVLAANRVLGTLLLQDAGDPLPTGATGWNTRTPAAPWSVQDSAALMRHLARVQRDSLPHLPDLRALGVPDHGPAHLRSRLHRLHDETLWRSGQPGGLSAEDAERLRAALPLVEGALVRLERSPVPPALGHGDLHDGNVLTRGGAFTVIDWSDASVTHPFLDVNPAYLVPADHADAAGEAYLAEWTDLAPPGDLRALLRDAVLAGEAYRALGYLDGILPGVEDPSEWVGALQFHLRALARHGGPVT
ncbi:phosphotransferase [Deinococcus aquiradiocola]|nr:phosphotransferase [Deinococcus aquiradiocola]